MALITSKREKTLLAVLSLIYGLITLWAVSRLVEYRIQNIITEKRNEAAQEVALVRSGLEAKVYESVYLSDSLATVITLNPELLKANWLDMASKLLYKSVYIRNIGIAPNDIISHIYPLAGNERALGLDFRSVPSQYASVLKAKEQGGVYIDGPLPLVQGGIALLARFPVFMDYPEKSNYWGVVSVVLNYDRLLADSGLTNVRLTEIALKRGDTVFYGREDTFRQPDFTTSVHLPNTRWEMAAVFRTDNLPAVERDRWLTYGLGGAGAFVFYLSILMLFRAYKLARTASLQDELTKLPNRRYLMVSLHNKLRQHQEKGGFTLLNIDLNGFKNVNDTLGHDAGDALLLHVANQLRRSVRSSDLVSRVGGDEYLLILDRMTDEKMVQQLINKIQQQLESSRLDWQGHQVAPSLSIGYAIYHADNPVDAEHLMAEADRKMYREKSERKDAGS